MTSQEARAIAKANPNTGFELKLKNVMSLIYKAASKGEYSIRIVMDNDDKIISELHKLGFAAELKESWDDEARRKNTVIKIDW